MAWWKRLSAIDWEVVAIVAFMVLLGLLLLSVMLMGAQVPFLKE